MTGQLGSAQPQYTTALPVGNDLKSEPNKEEITGTIGNTFILKKKF